MRTILFILYVYVAITLLAPRSVISQSSVVNVILLLISPFFLLVTWIIARLLFFAFNFQLHKRSFKGIPAVSDNLLTIKGWIVPDFDAKLLRELKNLSNENGKGSFPPVVFGGVYLNHGKPTLYINSPELCKQLADDTKFPKLPMTYDMVGFYIGNGIVTSAGSHWRMRRDYIEPLFYPNKLKNFAKHMTENAKEMVSVLKATESEVDIGQILGEVTLLVMIDSLFSGKIDSTWASQMWKKANEEFGMFVIGRLLVGRFINQFLPMRAGIAHNRNQFIEKFVELCQEAKAHPVSDADEQDFIQYLTHIKDSDGKQAISDYEIAEESLTMLFAGHDTTKNSVSWSLYYLAQNPAEVQKLQQEVDAVLQGRYATFDDLTHLKACRNALQEALRLKPPAPQIERITSDECILDKYTIPKGTTVMMNIQGVANDPSLWHDPSQFNPSRFETDESYAKNFFPFSLAPRNCVGNKFAMNEGIILIASIMQHFDVHMGKGKVNAVFEGTLMPKGLKCTFVPRK